MTRVVVWNDRSGAASLHREAVEQRLCDETCEMRTVPAGVDPADVVRAALADGADVVIAAGGDGTVSAVARVLAGTTAVLGVLPVGTLNHFARDAGIPLDLDSAIAVVNGGRTTRVDVGEVNGRGFVNNVSLGLYPQIVSARDRQREVLRRGKRHALFWASLAVLRRHRLLTVRLSVDGEVAVHRTPFVFVGNNAYEMELLRLGARGQLDRGMLCAYVAERSGRLALLRLGLRALAGRLRQAGDFRSYESSELSVEHRRRPLRVATDGELGWMSPPLRFRSRPGALELLVPEGAPNGV